VGHVAGVTGHVRLLGLRRPRPIARERDRSRGGCRRSARSPPM
jgi:hypothetical protein